MGRKNFSSKREEREQSRKGPGVWRVFKRKGCRCGWSKAPEGRTMLERSAGADNAGIPGLLGHGKHVNLLPQNIEKPLSKGTGKDQIGIFKR